jgi:hypothetical protein
MNCRRCERELRDPWSARAGIGPICAAKEIEEEGPPDGDDAGLPGYVDGFGEREEEDVHAS